MIKRSLEDNRYEIFVAWISNSDPDMRGRLTLITNVYDVNRDSYHVALMPGIRVLISDFVIDKCQEQGINWKQFVIENAPKAIRQWKEEDRKIRNK